MNIPQELLQEAKRASGVKTQTLAVILGLQELIRRKKLQELGRLAGSGAVRFSPQELVRMRRR
jgi:hypothetical protein